MRTEIVHRLPVDLAITFVAVLLAMRLRPHRRRARRLLPRRLVDRAITGVCSLAFTVPEFWLGILLVLVFAVQLAGFPRSGWVPLHEDPVGWLQHVLLPGLALSIPIGAMLARQLRTALVASTSRTT